MGDDITIEKGYRDQRITLLQEHQAKKGLVGSAC